MKIQLQPLRVVFYLTTFFLLIAGKTIRRENCELIDDEQICKESKTMTRKFSMPKLFRFELFEEKYARIYWSPLEMMARRKIYLGRAVQVFIVAILYKQRKTDSYIAINQFSDRTSNELKIMLMLTSKLELSDSKRFDKKQYSTNEGGEDDILVDIGDLEREIEEIRLNDSKSDYKYLAEELGVEVPGKPRTKRDTEDRKSLRLDDLAAHDKQQDDGKGNHKWPTFFGRVVNFFSKKWESIVKRASNFHLLDYINENKILEGSSVKEPDSRTQIGSKLPDEVYIDHRDSNCFFPPRDQGFCASCYAFAAIALHEWAQCKATGELIAFSEQYIVDCGSSFHHNLQGCQGGSLARIGEFINNFGLELRDNYPYMGKSYQCPYSAGASRKEIGFIRISYYGPETREFTPDKIDLFLKISPILIGIKTNSLFISYAGGIDLAQDCEGGIGTHAVLIVGSGRQDGEEYWLIRNSYSSDWGEEGYYKLNKRADCFLPERGYLSVPIFMTDPKENLNPDYNGSEIKNQRQIRAQDS